MSKSIYKEAFEQAQKQEKLLELYKDLISLKEDMLSWCEDMVSCCVVVDDEYHDMVKIEIDLEQQIKELEK